MGPIRFRSSKPIIDMTLFIVLFMALFMVYRLDSKMVLRPQSVHLWRQADCLSITQNYYQRDIPFWEPEIYNLMGDDRMSGKSAGEFPGLYYLVAKLWQVFGKSELLYRAVVLLLVFSGLYCLFRMGDGFLKDRVQALFICLMLYTSTIFVYYSINFLPNLPAFSLVLAAWYSLWKYHRSRLIHWLWLAMVLLSIGMLLKISTGTSYVALLGWLIIEWFRLPGKRELFLKPSREIIPFILPLLMVPAWYLYADWYNRIHMAYYTFNDLWPAWKMDEASMKHLVVSFRQTWGPELFPFPVWTATLAMWVFVLITYRKRPLSLNYLAVILPLGTVVYVIFWLKAFGSHDYYYIELYLLFILTWLLFFRTMNHYRWFRRWPVYLLLTGIVIVNAYVCSSHLDHRYNSWMNNWYTGKLETVGELEPLLLEHGIGPEDVVISLPDPSINASLYLMNRRGYTDYGSKLEYAEWIASRVDRGAQFLVIIDTSAINSALLQRFVDTPMFTHKNVRVYEIRGTSE